MVQKIAAKNATVEITQQSLHNSFVNSPYKTTTRASLSRIPRQTNNDISHVQNDNNED